MNAGTPSSRGATRKITVLLVDDQALVAQVVRRMFAVDPSIFFYYEQDAPQALASVNRIRPTIILLDLDMPGVNGIELLKAFRDNPLTQSISVIVLSSNEDSAVKQAAFEAGADDYLVKMPSRTELLARVRRHASLCFREMERLEEVRTLKEKLAGLGGKVAELTRLDEELTRSNADLEGFACVAAHDLQEPLRAVAGGVQLLARTYRGKLDQGGDDLIKMIADGSSRMQALVTNLLTYSRVGQVDRYETVDTAAALRQVLANLNSAVHDAKAEVIFENLPALRFLRGQFDYLLQNLVGNAIKYRGAAPPKVHISAVRQLDAWVFRVADNGIGFDPECTDKIFGLFQRLNGCENYAGTGIGLAVVKKLVERRGGWVWADSMPNQGSTFYFSVPDEDAPWQTSAGLVGEEVVSG